MIISRTPVRFSFLGGGTDYPSYYEREKGAVIGSTIDKYSYLSVTDLSDYFQHSIRVTYSKAELVDSISEIEHPSVRECLRHMDIDGNIEIHYFSDLPARTGLGSSSSFTVGLLKALNAHLGNHVGAKKLAEDAIHVEQEMIGERVGSQDQYHASFGGLNRIEFDAQNISVQPIPLKEEFLNKLSDSILMFYTGITRHAHEILDEQLEKTKREKNDEQLRQMYDLVDRAQTNLMDDQSIKAFGKTMHEGWELKKQLSDSITRPEINEAYEVARSAGAWGGKLAGAGGGGFLFFVVPDSKKQSVRDSIDLKEVPFSFENEGARIVYSRS